MFTRYCLLEFSTLCRWHCFLFSVFELLLNYSPPNRCLFENLVDLTGERITGITDIIYTSLLYYNAPGRVYKCIFYVTVYFFLFVTFRARFIKLISSDVKFISYEYLRQPFHLPAASQLFFTWPKKKKKTR